MPCANSGMTNEMDSVVLSEIGSILTLLRYNLVFVSLVSPVPVKVKVSPACFVIF